MKPAAYSRPLQAPDARPAAPPPAPHPQAPQAGAPTPADPQLAKEIAAAKAVQQSTDPTTQQIALQTLDCSKPDPLTGYDDPTLPLVTCNQDGTVKYVLGPSFLEGTQIASAQAAANGQGVGYVVNVTFKSAGEAIWGKYTTEHIGEAVAFTLDGKVVSAPTIQGAIFGIHRDLRPVQPGAGAEPRRRSCATGRCRCRSSRTRRRPSRPRWASPRWRPG